MRYKLRWWPSLVLAGLLVLALSSGFWAASGAGESGGQTALDLKIRAVLKTVINNGADIHNIYRDYAGCYRYYQGSLATLRGLLDHHPDLQKMIDAAVADAERAASIPQRGLILNTALRKIRDALGPNPKPIKEKPAADGKPKDKPADKSVPKDLLKDVKPADANLADKKPKSEKVPFDKPAKDK